MRRVYPNLKRGPWGQANSKVERQSARYGEILADGVGFRVFSPRSGIPVSLIAGFGSGTSAIAMLCFLVQGAPSKMDESG